MGKSGVIRATAAAIALAVAQPSTAADPTSLATGNELLLTCSADATPSFWSCSSYIDGVHMTVLMFDYYAVSPKPYCLAPGVTKGQMIDIIVTYLRAHPEVRHRPSPGLITMAFRGAFPCPTAKSVK